MLVRKLYKRDDSPVNLLATPEDLNAMNVQTNALVPSTHVGVSCDWRARNTSLQSVFLNKASATHAGSEKRED